MPQFRLDTNLPRSKIPQDFVAKAVPILAKMLGKPEEYCIVTVIPDVIMNFAGTSEPFVLANVMSIGQLGVEQNQRYSKILGELVEKELGVPSDRMYIFYIDQEKANVGYKKTTFQTIF